MALGGAYRLREILKSSSNGPTKGWDHFLWGEVTPRDTK